MLLRFAFSNFRSFREEQEFSMVAGPGKEREEVLIRRPGISEAVLPVAAIYGANASGKSNVLRALEFMVNAVRLSHVRWDAAGGIRREPFVGQEGPSRFVLDFLNDGIRYQYGFSISSEVVLKEWLYAYPKGKRQAWLTRESGTPMVFSEKMGGENRMIEGLTRPNSLFLSAAAQNNHIALLPIYQWFSRPFPLVGNRPKWKQWAEDVLCTDDEVRNEVVRMLVAADLGVSGVSVPSLSDRLLGTSRFNYKLHHQVSGQTVALDEEQESDGTVAYLVLLAPALSAIRDGDIVIIDELDSSLHPLLALQLIRLFNDPASNPKGAQLIFNTHDTNLLSGGVLRRDQIWFTEKGPDGASVLYPLSDFKPRKKENLENGYLQGRYGAIPFLNSDKIGTDAKG